MARIGEVICRTWQTADKMKHQRGKLKQDAADNDNFRVKRYLANAGSVLAPVKAVDFVFQQRVLPVLRGRGVKFNARMQQLRDRLAKDGLDRSARHVSDAIALADVNFGDIDFFAY